MVRTGRILIAFGIMALVAFSIITAACAESGEIDVEAVGDAAATVEAIESKQGSIEIPEIKLPNAPLAVVDWLCRTDSEVGYAYIEGLVSNNSTLRFENILAVGVWLDASGGFVTSDSALIDYTPLLPEQTSPFSVISRWNPAMEKCGLEFSEFGGKLIDHYNLPTPTPVLPTAFPTPSHPFSINLGDYYFTGGETGVMAWVQKEVSIFPEPGQPLFEYKSPALEDGRIACWDKPSHSRERRDVPTKYWEQSGDLVATGTFLEISERSDALKWTNDGGLGYCDEVLYLAHDGKTHYWFRIEDFAYTP